MGSVKLTERLEHQAGWICTHYKSYYYIIIIIIIIIIILLCYNYPSHPVLAHDNVILGVLLFSYSESNTIYPLKPIIPFALVTSYDWDY